MDILLMLDPLAAAILMLVVGICFCFFGRKLIIFALAVACFIMGWLYGGELISSLSDSSFLIEWGPWICGVLASVLGILLYKLSVFTAGALIVWFLLESHVPEVHIALRVFGALAAGGLLLAFRKPLLSMLTALLGSSMAALASVSILAHVAVSVSTLVYWLLLAVLAAAGFSVQMRSGRGK
jgi:hypothetical protein